MKKSEFILEGRVRVDASGIYFVSHDTVLRIGGVCFDREREELYWMCVLDDCTGKDLGV